MRKFIYKIRSETLHTQKQTNKKKTEASKGFVGMENHLGLFSAEHSGQHAWGPHNNGGHESLKHFFCKKIK